MGGEGAGDGLDLVEDEGQTPGAPAPQDGLRHHMLRILQDQRFQADFVTTGP